MKQGLVLFGFLIFSAVTYGNSHAQGQLEDKDFDPAWSTRPIAKEYTEKNWKLPAKKQKLSKLDGDELYSSKLKKYKALSNPNPSTSTSSLIVPKVETKPTAAPEIPVAPPPRLVATPSPTPTAVPPWDAPIAITSQCDAGRNAMENWNARRAFITANRDYLQGRVSSTAEMKSQISRELVKCMGIADASHYQLLSWGGSALHPSFGQDQGLALVPTADIGNRSVFLVSTTGQYSEIDPTKVYNGNRYENIRVYLRPSGELIAYQTTNVNGALAYVHRPTYTETPYISPMDLGSDAGTLVFQTTPRMQTWGN